MPEDFVPPVDDGDYDENNTESSISYDPAMVEMVSLRDSISSRNSVVPEEGITGSTTPLNSSQGIHPRTVEFASTPIVNEPIPTEANSSSTVANVVSPSAPHRLSTTPEAILHGSGAKLSFDSPTVRTFVPAEDLDDPLIVDTNIPNDSPSEVRTSTSEAIPSLLPPPPASTTSPRIPTPILRTSTASDAGSEQVSTPSPHIRDVPAAHKTPTVPPMMSPPTAIPPHILDEAVAHETPPVSPIPWKQTVVDAAPETVQLEADDPGEASDNDTAEVEP